jgi:hypothetical protein
MDDGETYFDALRFRTIVQPARIAAANPRSWERQANSNNPPQRGFFIVAVAKKLGNDYRLWIESATPGTYNMIKGQQDLSINRSPRRSTPRPRTTFPMARRRRACARCRFRSRSFPICPMPPVTPAWRRPRWLRQRRREVPDPQGRHDWQRHDRPRVRVLDVHHRLEHEPRPE